MNNTAESNDILKGLCTGQPLAVLATDAGNGPYASLVAVAVTPDLRQLFFTTLRATRKWANLAGNHHVSLLIDNRSNQVTDFSRAAALAGFTSHYGDLSWILGETAEHSRGLMSLLLELAKRPPPEYQVPPS